MDYSNSCTGFDYYAGGYSVDAKFFDGFVDDAGVMHNFF